MEVSVPKTEYMLVRKDECAGAVAEQEYHRMEFKHECKWCGMKYPTKDGLAIHTGSCKVEEGTFEQEFEVEKVLDVRGTQNERFYLVLKLGTGRRNLKLGRSGGIWRTQWTK